MSLDVAFINAFITRAYVLYLAVMRAPNKPRLTIEITGWICELLAVVSVDLREAYLDSDTDRIRDLAAILRRLSSGLFELAGRIDREFGIRK